MAGTPFLSVMCCTKLASNSASCDSSCTDFGGCDSAVGRSRSPAAGLRRVSRPEAELRADAGPRAEAGLREEAGLASEDFVLTFSCSSDRI